MANPYDEMLQEQHQLYANPAENHYQRPKGDLESRFVEQLRTEIKRRLTQTDDIRKQFRESYSGYSSNVAQIALFIALGLLVLLSIGVILKVETIFQIIPTANYNRDSILVMAACGGICLYVVLLMYKKIIHITRIAQIDVQVSKVTDIRARLNGILSGIDGIAADLNKRVFASDNEKIIPERNLDAEIEEYAKRAKSFSNPDDNALGFLIAVIHWVSGVVFVGVLLFITTTFVADKLGGLLKIHETQLIATLYVALIVIAYVFIQELYVKKPILSIHEKIKSNLGLVIIAACIAGLLYLFIYPNKEFTFLDTSLYVYDSLISCAMLIVTPCIFVLIGSLFSFIICSLCEIDKKIIGIVFLGCALGALIYCIAGLHYFSVTNGGLSFFNELIVLNIPILTTTICAALLYELYNHDDDLDYDLSVDNNTYVNGIFGSAIAYAIITFIICKTIGHSIMSGDALSNLNQLVIIVAGLCIVGFFIYLFFMAEPGGCLELVFVIGVVGALLLIWYFASGILFWITVPLFFTITALISLLPGIAIIHIGRRIKESR